MSLIDDFNRGAMRAGTAFENPLAMGAERTGQDWAKAHNGGGTGAGPGGGVGLVAIFALAIAVVVALPTLSLAFFATPVLFGLLRLRGKAPGYRAVFVAASAGIFVFILIFVTMLWLQTMLMPFMGDSSPVLAVIHTAQMIEAAWTGTQSNIIIPEMSEWLPSLAMQSGALIALSPSRCLAWRSRCVARPAMAWVGGCGACLSAL